MTGNITSVGSMNRQHWRERPPGGVDAMRAAIITGPGGPEVFQVEEVDMNRCTVVLLAMEC